MERRTLRSIRNYRAATSRGSLDGNPFIEALSDAVEISEGLVRRREWPAGKRMGELDLAGSRRSALCTRTASGDLRQWRYDSSDSASMSIRLRAAFLSASFWKTTSRSGA
jgi:hypothetical protein